MRIKHSPGPWAVGVPGDFIGTNAVFDANGVIVADASDRSSQASDRQRAANAHLIAAAPELMAALANYQRLVAYLQRTTNLEEWATHGDWGRLQKEAAAVIDKVTGARNG